MEKFYLENADFYRALLKSLNKTSPEPRTPQQLAFETTSPDVVVCARIRPLLEEDVAAGFPCAVFPRVARPGIIDIHDLYNHPRGRPILKADTGEIYDSLVADLVAFASNGGVGTLFAYGQTGSGKTFTISQLEKLVAMSLMEGNDTSQRQVHMTIIDLAGNSAHDLLNSREPISILEDSFGATQLAGAVEHQVRCRDDMMELIERAASFRRTAPTLKNDSSSRSHGICRIRITNPAAGPDSAGLLYLIDLAGSEAARDVATHGADRMRETREINMSLSVLKDCIRNKAELDALASAGRGRKSKQRKPRVPFRQSALTKVLKHVFEPSVDRACKMVVIACINPSIADVGPSKNTLRYAEMLRVMVPTTSAKVNHNHMDPMTWTDEQLKEWIIDKSGTCSVGPAGVPWAESLAQLVRLPKAEFENRCSTMMGVNSEQVKSIRSKFWQMHLDSQHGSPGTSPGDPTGLDGANLRGQRPTSRILTRELNNPTTVPLRKRLRPGMIVSWNRSPSSDAGASISDGSGMAVILCPVQNLDGAASAANPTQSVETGTEARNSHGRGRYLCGQLTPGQVPESYELSLWNQIVIDVDVMDKEVIMEYDAQTRYYYVSV
ncbi:kinesin motor domain containing protein [Metarhizium guizhouense ARSEF 977]|uniref:Kinesin motor domain containing protein n=1 Tax=Metarhizium guizhouense (strain ARSEF 977) TaxID=1276136 RepID=A0A0B4GZ48_METGA|nr:kinesin motor domain containing protein [Metarhizium guizhouense ARSEF 977]